MPQLYLYSTGSFDSCGECSQWDGQTGTAEELPETPNTDCYNGSCNCYREEIDGEPGEDCEAEGLLDCEDSEGFAFCGVEGDDGCGEGCWCTEGLDPQDGEEVECQSPYWDENCICTDECEERDD